MSIEEALAANTAALKANTAAHLKLAEVAMAAQGTKTVNKTDDKPAAAKPAAKPAAKKPTAKKVEKPEIAGTATLDEVKTSAKAYMLADGEDDEAGREAAKANVGAAFKHLGVKNLSGLDDEDRAKLAGYIAYWAAGLEVAFEEIDGLVAEANEGGAEEAEEMLG